MESFLLNTLFFFLPPNCLIKCLLDFPTKFSPTSASYRLNGVVNCGARHEHIYKRTMLLTKQVRVSKGSPIVTCLREGPSVLRLQWQLLLVLTTIFPMSR